MKVSLIMRQLSFGLIIWLLAVGLAVAADAAKQNEYEPEVGQEGKDVVWVPTPQALVDRMLDMAQVTSKDYLIDLGSGDGRTVITAAKRGVRAHGIEYNPDMVELSKRNAAKEGVSNKATFEKADLFERDFSKATVLTLFLLPEINLKLRPKILDLRPGTRVVSNSFDMGEWEPDETFTLSEGCNNWCTAYLWIVPAKAQGTWKLQPGELKLKQNFQMVTGTLEAPSGAVEISDGKINGERIGFNVGNRRYTGRINGNTMQGTISSGGNWRAIRAGS